MRQALILLASEEINFKDAKDLSVDFQIWDSNPSINTYNHHDARIDLSRNRFKKNKHGIAVTVQEIDGEMPTGKQLQTHIVGVNREHK